MNVNVLRLISALQRESTHTNHWHKFTIFWTLKNLLLTSHFHPEVLVPSLLNHQGDEQAITSAFGINALTLYSV